MKRLLYAVASWTLPREAEKTLKNLSHFGKVNCNLVLDKLSYAEQSEPCAHHLLPMRHIHRSSFTRSSTLSRCACRQMPQTSMPSPLHHHAGKSLDNWRGPSRSTCRRSVAAASSLTVRTQRPWQTPVGQRQANSVNACHELRQESASPLHRRSQQPLAPLQRHTTRSTLSPTHHPCCALRSELRMDATTDFMSKARSGRGAQPSSLGTLPGPRCVNSQ